MKRTPLLYKNMIQLMISNQCDLDLLIDSLMRYVLKQYLIAPIAKEAIVTMVIVTWLLITLFVRVLMIRDQCVP